ncbi:hypothetical protein NS44R_15175 [Mammaliicoccus sciuri]|nr:hypothetical protein NS44R_15175 [Mammaliicoccus sciuri]
MGGGAPGTAGEGKGAGARARRACRRAAADALDGGREAVCVRGTEWQGEPARPFRRPPAADRLPRVLRARRVRLAGSRLPRLLARRRSGQPSLASQPARHHAGLRLARAASRHRAAEGADGVGDAVVHDHRQFRR